jgi:aarF domain-containing kinase
LKVISAFVSLAAWLFPSACDTLALKGALKQFSALMTSQVDLRKEADNLEAFHRNFEAHPAVSFPRPLRQFCRRDVLVETFETGQHMADFLENASGNSDTRKAVAQAGVDMLLKMVL